MIAQAQLHARTHVLGVSEAWQRDELKTGNSVVERTIAYALDDAYCGFDFMFEIARFR